MQCSLKGNSMCEIKVNQNENQEASMVPTGGGTWKVGSLFGVLYGFGKGGSPYKIKQSDESIPLSRIGGCGLRGIKSLQIISKRISTGESVEFLVTITDISRPDFRFDFVAKSSLVIELSWDGVVIKCEVLGKLDNLLRVKPGKLKAVQPAHVQPIKKITQDHGPFAIYFTKKHQPVGERHGSHRSLVLTNDGVSLYSIVNEERHQLFYKRYHKEVAANSVPGGSFLESTVLFRTFGHTLNGKVIISLREKYNNWSMVVSISKGQTLAIYDYYRSMSVVKI